MCVECGAETPAETGRGGPCVLCEGDNQPISAPFRAVWIIEFSFQEADSDSSERMDSRERGRERGHPGRGFLQVPLRGQGSDQEASAEGRAEADFRDALQGKQAVR